jgi:hypothetical protein
LGIERIPAQATQKDAAVFLVGLLALPAAVFETLINTL